MNKWQGMNCPFKSQSVHKNLITDAGGVLGILWMEKGSRDSNSQLTNWGGWAGSYLSPLHGTSQWLLRSLKGRKKWESALSLSAPIFFWLGGKFQQKCMCGQWGLPQQAVSLDCIGNILGRGKQRKKGLWGIEAVNGFIPKQWKQTFTTLSSCISSFEHLCPKWAIRIQPVAI